MTDDQTRRDPAERRRKNYEAGVIDTTDRKTPQSFDTAAPGPIDPLTGRHAQYWVLSEVERAKGFVRPVRTSYKHVGIAGPTFSLRDLTASEVQVFGDYYAKFEAYPDGGDSLGRFWMQAQLNQVDKGCGTVTTMGRALAETYARDPYFYGATMCVRCGMHLPVGRDGEFVWDGTDERVGT